jgi:GNAT superfamily N-acetyltransferase
VVFGKRGDDVLGHLLTAFRIEHGEEDDEEEGDGGAGGLSHALDGSIRHPIRDPQSAIRNSCILPRVFASVELAARIDSAEGRLCADIVLASPENPTVRSLITPLAGGLVVYAGPGSPMNKGIGLAITDPLEEAVLAAVEEEWRDRNEPMRIELSSLARPEAATMLTARGYRLVGFENQLGCVLQDWKEEGYGLRASGSGQDIVVESLAESDEKLWRDVTVDGFAQPDASPTAHEMFPRQVLDDIFITLGRTGGFRRYVARIDGHAAGAASIRIDGDIAQLSGAATLPAFRRRGVQTALLRHRLLEARDTGCVLAVVTTQPGSTSQANSQRRGFALLYTRAILVRAWER